MFNVLISANETAWETEARMEMLVERFKEHSGFECEDISIDRPESLKTLERIQTFLIYENGVHAGSHFVRVGQMRDIRVRSSLISFLFSEAGRIADHEFEEVRDHLQIGNWEMVRTHWAIKDGHVPQNVLALMTPTPKMYDIVLSFAGEDRAYVEEVAKFLELKNIAVFYDEYEATTLWGKDLVEHFDGVYRRQGRYCIMFISRHYAEKMWTKHERKSALARALEERTEYVLPVRFDDTDIPGLQPTIGYLDLRRLSPTDLGKRILEKLGREQ